VRASCGQCSWAMIGDEATVDAVDHVAANPEHVVGVKVPGGTIWVEKKEGPPPPAWNGEEPWPGDAVLDAWR
jgi:hypothetical protein